MLVAGPMDVVWNISDTGWAKCAWSSFFATWLHGACVFIQHTSKFDPVDMLKVRLPFFLSPLLLIKFVYFCVQFEFFPMGIKFRMISL